MCSRGCFFNCTFCHNNIHRRLYKGKGKYFRVRSTGNAIAELKMAKRKYRIKAVDFQDELFTGDGVWFKEFIESYKQEIGLPYKCTTHPNCFSLEIARLLKESGCRRLMMGIQSMWQPIRKEILHRPEVTQQVENTLRLCDETGIPYSLDHMFGIPGETEEGYEMAAEVYVRRSRYLQRIKCFYLSYYPETEIVGIARAKGALSDEDLDKIDRVSEERFFFSDSLKKRDPQMAKTAKNFEVFFKLLPVMPRWLAHFILRKKIYRAFHLVPWTVLLVVELLIGLRNRDFAMMNYVRYYYRHTRRRLFPVAAGRT